MTRIASAAYGLVTLALLIASADLAAAPRRGMGAGMAAPMGAGMTATPGADMKAGMDTGMAASMDAGMGAGMGTGTNGTGNGAGQNVDPPSPDQVLAPEDHVYRPVRLEVRSIVWFEPGQRGLIEAHPLVMGLAAMALATVTLLFFFLRGVKRPKGKEL